MRGSRRIFCLVLTVFLLALNVGVMCSDNAEAATRKLDWGWIHHVDTADGGASYSEDVWGAGSVADGGASTQTGTVWTYTHAHQGSATRHSYLYAEFTADSDFTGTVWCTMKGEYYADAYAAMDILGIGDAYVYYKLIVKTSGGQVVEEVIIDYVIRWGGWSPSYLAIGPASYDTDGSWTAVPGTTYRVYMYALGHASGAIDQWSNGYYLTWASLDVYCQVPPGFGGCVLEGTDILLADGTTAPVETLKKGDLITSYDTSTMSPLTETVLVNEKSKVDVIENINNGLLYVTPTDQPIYARNDSYTGWIANPCDLEVGWYILNPVEGEWIEITSIDYEVGKFKVYEIGATGVDNYVANGILLDRKPIKG